MLRVSTVGIPAATNVYSTGARLARSGLRVATHSALPQRLLRLDVLQSLFSLVAVLLGLYLNLKAGAPKPVRSLQVIA